MLFATLIPLCKRSTSRAHPARRRAHLPPLQFDPKPRAGEGLGDLGKKRWWLGGDGWVMGKPPPPLPLSTHRTAANTASRSAFMVRRCGQRDAQDGWLRAGLAIGPGAGGGERPAAPPPGPARAPHRLPPRPSRVRLVSFTRSAEPISGKLIVHIAPRLARARPAEWAESLAGVEPTLPWPCPKGFFHRPFSSPPFP